MLKRGIFGSFHHVSKGISGARSMNSSSVNNRGVSDGVRAGLPIDATEGKRIKGEEAITTQPPVTTVQIAGNTAEAVVENRRFQTT